MKMISNPLIEIIILLFIILIILGMIRLSNPDFSLGASVSGNFGTIKARASLEGFNGSREPLCKYDRECGPGGKCWKNMCYYMKG